MSHQALARKWRPHNFSEIIGQEHVTQSLINALIHNRLHHAYLFTGTRGVGKTTVARILAKAINCENLIDANPCGSCTSCLALAEGRLIDLIEVDAASKTKVEDTRDLLDNAQYAPNSSQYKVYLIDEVHMLSTHSFNALLKTLEEPPEHVKFLLATTDPQKIPATVLSRCLQFNLKRLTISQICQQMAYILTEERIDFESDALTLLANAADGSMRDGLSLLDQAIIYNAEITVEVVSLMLGSISDQPIKALLQHLADNNALELLNKISEIAELSPDFSMIIQKIIYLLYRLVLIKSAPDILKNSEDKLLLEELSVLFSVEQLQLYYQIALLGQKDLMLAPQPQIGFEMIMLRMLAFNPQSVVQQTNIAPPIVTVSNPAIQQLSNPSSENIEQPVDKVQEKIENPVVNHNWLDMINTMNLKGFVRELANNCVLDQVNENQCQLLLDNKNAHISNERLVLKLEKSLQDFYKRPLKLVIKLANLQINTPQVEYQQAAQQLQQEAVKAIDENKDIEALKLNFDARVLPDSIEPV